MPQGSLKKIEVQLLLADLALQFGNACACRLKLRRWRLRRRLRTCAARGQTGRFGLGRPTATAQRLRTAGLETIPPDIQILARHLQLTREAGRAIEIAYWERMPILWIECEDTDASVALENLISVGRARDGVHFVGYEFARGRKFESDVLVGLLLEAAQQPINNEADGNYRTMFQHFVTEILKRLDKAGDVPTDMMLKVEWAYLPLLERSDRPAKVITRELAANPELFVQMICAIYKPSDDSGIIESPPEDAEHARNIATQAYRLLRLWDVIPGTAADEKIDGSALRAWVREVRKLAKAAGRDEVAEQKIGEVLSWSPIDDDGIWPALAIRELIEDIRSSHVEAGLLIGRRNRRGVTTRLPRDGGAQERTLVQQYGDWSKATCFDWPRTSAILEKLAQSYEEDARWHDNQAERLDW